MIIKMTKFKIGMGRVGEKRDSVFSLVGRSLNIFKF